MESKYKVGDKVRIKSLDWYNSNKDEDGEIGLHSDEYLFLEVMSEYCGKECEVSHVYSNGEYSLKGNGWIWNDWMFEEELSAKEQQVLEQIERVQVELDKLRALCNSK